MRNWRSLLVFRLLFLASIAFFLLFFPYKTFSQNFPPVYEVTVPESCIPTPIYGATPEEAANNYVSANNSVAPSCGSGACTNPVTLDSVSSSSFVVKSVCTGSLYTRILTPVCLQENYIYDSNLQMCVPVNPTPTPTHTPTPTVTPTPSPTCADREPNECAKCCAEAHQRRQAACRGSAACTLKSVETLRACQDSCIP